MPIAVYKKYNRFTLFSLIGWLLGTDAIHFIITNSK